MNNDRTNKTANILLVDDCLDNLRLLMEVLSRHNYTVRPIPNSRLVLKAIEAELPDLILLDIMMPQPDGYEICAKLKASEKTRHIPIVFLTALNETFDKVKAFSLGGSDYITKPFEIGEVLVRVENQLKIAELQKQLQAQNSRLQQEIYDRQLLENKLRTSQEEIRAFLEAMSDIVTIVDIDANTIDIAPTNIERFYPPNSRILDRTVAKIFDEKDNFFRRHIRRAINDREIVNCEYSLPVGDDRVWFAASITPISGNKVALVARDITVAKHLEEIRLQAEEKLKHSEAKLSAAQRVAHIGNWEYDTNTQEITWSEETFLIFGLDPNGNEPTYAELLRLIHPKDRHIFQKSVNLASQMRVPYGLDLRVLRPDGSIANIESRGETILDESGKVKKLFGTVLDITSRKQTEDELRLLLETTQAIGKSPSIDSALNTILNLICTTIDWDFGEAWIPAKDGHFLEYSWGWYGNKPYLEEFRQYSQKMQLTANMGLAGRIWASGQPEWIEDVYPPYKSISLRREIAAKVGLKSAFGVPVIANKKVLIVLVFFKRTSCPKNQRFIDLVSAVAAQLGSLMQQKLAEEALAVSEERLQLALEGSNLGLWDWHLDTGKVYRNSQWKKMLGYEDDEIADNHEAFDLLIHPEDVPVVKEALNAYFRGEKNCYEAEFRMRSKSGEWKWILCHGKIFEWDELGKPVRMTGTHRDISDRKQVELDLLVVTERLQHLLTSSPAVIYSCKAEEDLAFTFVSDNVTSVLGYAARDFLEDNRFWSSRIHPNDARSVFIRLVQNLFSKGFHAYEYRFLHQNGSYRWMYAQVKLITDKNGNPIECIGYWTDITDRKKVELAWRKSQKRYQTLTEASPVCIFNTDANGNCLYVNQGWSEITGLSLAEARGSGWTSNLHPEDRDRILTEWYFAAEARVPFKSEYRMVRPDGKITWVIGQAIAEIGEDGEIKGYVGTITDISDRKLAEETLRESVEREKALSTVIQKMRQSLDIETIFAATTSELRQTIDCDRVLVYRFNADWSGEFVAESVENGWISFLENVDANMVKNTIAQGDCAVKKLSAINNLIRDTYLEETQGGIYSRGAHYLAVANIYNQGFTDCYIELLERLQAKAYIIVPIYCGDRLWGLLAIYQNANYRQWKAAEINIVVHIGNQLGVALQQAELLQQTKRQSEALQKTLLAADAANRAKSEFLASMSHELRTPLNAILGFSQVMSRNNSLPVEERKNLEIINRAGEHLLSLIDDILEVSKIEAGRTTFNENSFDLIYLLGNLEKMLQLKAAAKGLQLISEYAPDLPQYVRTDEGKLRQVLLNLLGNAIKFTEEGRVTLRVSVVNSQPEAEAMPRDAEAEKLTLHFEVEDTGPGISPEEINLLFEAFAQTETGRKSQQGTGLGLPISQKYVQLMGGEIKASSSLSKGSLFSFDISIIKEEGADESDFPIKHDVIGLVKGQPAYRISIVDDSPDSRLLLHEILQPIGFSTCEASNGKEAVEIWSTWEPHLILMDMRMPLMDGYEATKLIRKLEREKNSHSSLANRTVIIAFTASAFEEQRQMILSSGCDDLIRKPFKTKVLLDKISQYLGVQYEYELGNKDIENPDGTPEQVVTEEDLIKFLSEMPSDWVTKVGNAASECSDDLVLELLEQVPAESAALAKAFANLAENFLFDRIVALIQRRA